MLVIMLLLVRIIGLWPALAGLAATCTIGPVSAWISSKVRAVAHATQTIDLAPALTCLLLLFPVETRGLQKAPPPLKV